MSDKPILELGFRFNELLDIEFNKPDFKELEFGSPISPLITQRSAPPSLTHNSSSSASSSGLNVLNQFPKNSHSGELTVTSETKSVVSNSKPDHRRSSSSGNSHMLLYSGNLSSQNVPTPISECSQNSRPGVTKPIGNDYKPGHRRSCSSGNSHTLLYSARNVPNSIPEHSERNVSSERVQLGDNSKPGHRRSSSNGNWHPLKYSGSLLSQNVPNPILKRSENVFEKLHTGDNFNSGHSRSNSVGNSHPLIYSGGGSSLCSTPAKTSPLGKTPKITMSNRTSRSDVLGLGYGNYGHGSIIRSGVCGNSKGNDYNGSNPEDLKREGNEEYKKGNFGQALSLYDRAISLSPSNAAYRSNRAAALAGLGRLHEAVKECEEAIRLEPEYGRAHYRLASILLKLGEVETARKHLSIPGKQTDLLELHNLQTVEKHINKCSELRKSQNWKCLLREVDSAISAGANYSAQLFACRAEALLKLHKINDADYTLSSIPKFEPPTQSCSQTKYFGMFCEAYLFLVRAQIEMTLGRFEKSITSIEKAMQIDPQSVEISTFLNNVKLVSRARGRGNDLFKSERFTEACAAYSEGLRLNPLNSVLYCNRAACYFQLGLWEKSVEDCSHALDFQPNYIKALLRRAASNFKLERWADAINDYKVLRKELPDDNEVTESLLHAQVFLKKSHGEEVPTTRSHGEIVEISSLDKFKAAICAPGVSVVYFKAFSDAQCKQISPLMDNLCSQYLSINFLKVDVEVSPAIADSENVRATPTFKIFKNGVRVNEMMCPSHEMLEYSVRHYSI